MKKLISFLSVIAMMVMTFGSSPAMAAGGITAITYTPSGSVGRSFVQPSTTLGVFTPTIAIVVTNEITFTLPAGTIITEGNVAVGDFTIEQAASGTSAAGNPTAPTGVTPSTANRTLIFVVAANSLSTGGDSAGLGVVTVKMAVGATGNEIQNPAAPATGLTFAVATTTNDTGNIATVAFITAAITAASDTLSNVAISAASIHTLRFTTPTGDSTIGDTIILTFPSDFNFTGKNINTITFTHGVTGTESNEPLAAAPSATEWGAALDGGTNRVLTLTLPTDGVGTAALAANDKIIITYSAANTVNATVANDYNVVVSGTFSNAGNIPVSVGPVNIANLRCLGSSAPGNVYLGWTVPLGATGGYVAHYSTGDITTENLFNGATNFAGAAAWVNGTVGSSVGAQLVTGLSTGGTYFFNVKAKGLGTSVSAISNAGVICAAGSAATSSTATTTSLPTSSIITPSSGSASAAEAPVTITGVSSDNGISSIKKVEVSTDGGTTWAEAIVLTANSTYGFSWTYDWTLPAEGPHTIKTRATNWVGVVETPGAGITVTVSPKSGIIQLLPGQTAPAGATTAAATISAMPYANPVGATQITANITYLQEQLLTLLQQLVALLQTQLQALGH